MIESLVGNKTAEKVLLFMCNYEQAFAREIATTFGLPLFSVQNQLKKLENGGFFVSKMIGRSKVYYWNPRNPFIKELKALLSKVLSSLPEDEIERYYRRRMRPRRRGKPL